LELKRTNASKSKMRQMSKNTEDPAIPSFGKAVSKEKIFFKLANQKQELPMAAMFANGSELNDQSL
jgi:hypothetical protein